MSPRIDWSSAKRRADSLRKDAVARAQHLTDDALSRSPIMPYDMPSGSTLTLGPGLGTVYPTPREFPELVDCLYCRQSTRRSLGACQYCGGRLSE